MVVRSWKKETRGQVLVLSISIFRIVLTVLSYFLYKLVSEKNTLNTTNISFFNHL